MKRFWGFVLKEFLHIFRDSRTMLILFGMPIVQILLFGYVITNELKDIKIAILDQSKDPVTIELTNKIISSGFFILDRNIKSMNEVEDVFKEGNIKQVIIFESGFGKKLKREGTANIQLIADASDANTANLVVHYTVAIITDFVREQNKLTGSPIQFIPEVRMLYNSELKGVYMFMTLQTIWGYVHMFVYDTGRDMMAKGIIPAGNMLPEVAFIKLGWVLGQTDDPQEVKKMMLTPINDEITDREPYNGYLVFQGGIPEVEEFIRRVHK